MFCCLFFSEANRHCCCDNGQFEPHELFLRLLEFAGWDHSLLLDLLTSPETQFLLYLVRYLKYASRYWLCLVNICSFHCSNVKRTEAEEKSNKAKCDARSSVSLSSRADIFALSNKLNLQKEVIRNDPKEHTDDLNVETTDNENSRSDARDSSTKTKHCPPLHGHPLQDSSASRLSPSMSGTNSNPGNRFTFRKLIDYPDTDSSSGECDDVVNEISETYLEMKFGVKRFKLSHGSDNRTSSPSKDSNRDRCQSTDHDCSRATGQNDVGTEDDSDGGSADHSYCRSVQGWLSVGALEPSSNNFGGTLDRVMTVLIQLRLSIERLINGNVFPYNAAPLLRLLERCEFLYES